ncbi:hypothetical protein [Jannaschia pohangensis]|uniref:Uncharacterized protein n=1 Tax=Jannaschia pohangensis TaxID=390807 RepID=A0A1I3JQ01_9RHOB|nr:hypothetical protein [Jannaschia pohangensis]SFI62352.1 hypothetical protein SAMN04488095_1393 [Jannaschia pohangensis]
MTDATSGWLKVRRIDPEGGDEWIVRQGERELMRLAPGQAALAIMDVGPVANLVIEVAGHRIPMPGLTVAEGATAVLEVRPLPQSVVQRMLGRPPPLRAEVSEEKARPGRTVTSQFWAGTADSRTVFWDVFAERQFPEPRTDEEQWEQDEIPISLFAELQGEHFIDHDFTEGDFVGNDGPWEARVKPYSWSGHWAETVRARAAAAGHPAPNAFWMVGLDQQPNRKPEAQVRAPRDIEVPGLRMSYLGEITHPA